MFNENYYKQKRQNVLERFQRIKDKALNDIATVIGNVLQEQTDTNERVSEIDQIIKDKGNTMSDETPQTPETPETPAVAPEVAPETAPEATPEVAPAPAE